MDSSNPLSQLADIHLPEPVGFWPPAPGWWILLFILCALLFWTARRYYANWRLQRARSFAIRELDKCMHAFQDLARNATKAEVDSLKLNLASDVNAVLRRVAMKNFSHHNFASLSGAAWISFLRKHGNATLLDDTLAFTLSDGRFAKQWEVDEQRLHQMAQQWIGSVYLARITPQKPSNNASAETPVSDHA